MKTTQDKLITENQSLNNTSMHEEHIQIPIYNNKYGKLYIHHNSMSISGIVRARTWEDAYSICEDEFFPAGDDEALEAMDEIETMDDGEEKNHAWAYWDESYGYRGNTRRMDDGSLSSIYAKDLNGDSLDLLTPELIERLGIKLNISENK